MIPKKKLIFDSSYNFIIKCTEEQVYSGKKLSSVFWKIYRTLSKMEYTQIKTLYDYVIAKEKSNESLTQAIKNSDKFRLERIKEEERRIYKESKVQISKPMYDVSLFLGGD